MMYISVSFRCKVLPWTMSEWFLEVVLEMVLEVHIVLLNLTHTWEYIPSILYPLSLASKLDKYMPPGLTWSTHQVDR